MFIKRADLGDGNIMSVSDPILKAQNHPPFVLQRHRVADCQIRVEARRRSFCRVYWLVHVC